MTWMVPGIPLEKLLREACRKVLVTGMPLENKKCFAQGVPLEEPGMRKAGIICMVPEIPIEKNYVPLEASVGRWL